MAWRRRDKAPDSFADRVRAERDAIDGVKVAEREQVLDQLVSKAQALVSRREALLRADPNSVHVSGGAAYVFLVSEGGDFGAAHCLNLETGLFHRAHGFPARDKRNREIPLPAGSSRPNWSSFYDQQAQQTLDRLLEVIGSE